MLLLDGKKTDISEEKAPQDRCVCVCVHLYAELNLIINAVVIFQ